MAVALTGTSEPGRAGSERFHPALLDALNFLLADVRGALGPYLNVFLAGLMPETGLPDRARPQRGMSGWAVVEYPSD